MGRKIIMKRKKYKTVYDGEWIQPKKGWSMRCCDCGLVHQVEFRIVNGKVQLAATRNKRATAASRKGKRFRDSIKKLNQS
jgi:Zn-finger protein